ncbi:MAG: hypothetical protein AAF587_37370 [Bacteroidota bacterium]
MELVKNQGLDPEGAEALAEKLDELLAEYQIYHSNLHKIHYDPKLRPFLDLSEKVERLYGLTQYNREYIAEQILKLGHQPTDYSSSFDQALMKTGVSQIQEVRGFEGAVYALIYTSHQLLESVKEVFYLAAEFQAKDAMAAMGQLAQQLTFAIGVFASVRLAHLN